MKKKEWISILILQGLNILFSLSAVAVKFTSIFWEKYGILSKEVIGGMLVVLMLMAGYAFFWQKILTRIPLTIAYLNKGTIIFWTLLWSSVFFSERVTLMNIVGIIIVFTGIGLVNANE